MLVQANDMSFTWDQYTATHLEDKYSRLNNLIFILIVMKCYLKIW